MNTKAPAQIFRDTNPLSASLSPDAYGDPSGVYKPPQIYKPSPKYLSAVIILLTMLGGFLLLIFANDRMNSVAPDFSGPFFFLSLAVYAAVVIPIVSAVLKNSPVNKFRRSLAEMFAPEVVARLEEQRGVERVAAQNHSSHAIPLTVTYLYVGYFIGSLAESGDPAARKQAAELARAQNGGPISPAGDFIDSFAADKTVYLVGESFEGHESHPDLKDGRVGSIILTTTYLYFFPNGQRDALSIRKNGNSQYIFDGRTISELKERFRDQGSFAVPLKSVSGVRPTMVKQDSLEVHYLEIEDDDGAKHWLTCRPSFLSITAAMKKQASLMQVYFWMQRIQWASAVEGNLLVGLESKRQLVKHA